MDEYSRLDIGESRTFGYYDNFNDADNALKTNACDMHEYIYHYAILEKIDAGVYPTLGKRWFYKYDKEKDGFHPIEEPKEFEHYGNIAFG